jgi:LPXTG-motif cell wall-anchored protein
MSRRARMRIVAITVILGSLGIGSAAMAVGRDPNGSGPPGLTGNRTDCPHTGYDSRNCAQGHVNGQATTTTQPGAATLPRTGTNSGYAVFSSLSCIAGGALLLIRRRNWTR